MLPVFAATQPPSYIDNIPSEIVSEIILNVLDGFGDNTYLKWRFPLLVRHVSKRFYHITNDTRSAWRYIYIRHPLHPYLQTHISRSEPYPLVMDAMYDSSTMGVWREMIDLILPTFPRLTSLVFYSPSDNSPIHEIFRHQMPVLKLLDVRGLTYWGSALEFSPSLTPALRSLRSVDCFPFHSPLNLPETLERLHIRSWWNDAYRSEDICISLPKGLRALRVEGITLWGSFAHCAEKIRLPCLNELHFYNCHSDGTFPILLFLDAPFLQTLTVELTRLPRQSDFADWFTNFPVLTHLEWRPGNNPPELAHIFRQCNALKSLSIKPLQRWPELEPSAAFVEALAREPSLLPLLESLFILGAPLPSLRELVRARPGLTRLGVHRSDLRPDLTSEWVPSYIKFYIDDYSFFRS